MTHIGITDSGNYILPAGARPSLLAKRSKDFQYSPAHYNKAELHIIFSLFISFVFNVFNFSSVVDVAKLYRNNRSKKDILMDS